MWRHGNHHDCPSTPERPARMPSPNTSHDDDNLVSCGVASGYHDDGDPMTCQRPEGHHGPHCHGTCGEWSVEGGALTEAERDDVRGDCGTTHTLVLSGYSPPTGAEALAAWQRVARLRGEVAADRGTLRRYDPDRDQWRPWSISRAARAAWEADGGVVLYGLRLVPMSEPAKVAGHLADACRAKVEEMGL